MGGVPSEASRATQFVNYYSLERLRRGSGRHLLDDNEALILELLDHDINIWGHLVWGLIQIQQGSFVPIQLKDADAFINVGSASLFSGTFDPRAVVSFWRDVGVDIETQARGSHVVLTATDSSTGSTEIPFVVRRMLSNTGQIVSTTEYISTNADAGVDEHFDRRLAPPSRPEVDELIALLDDREVYSATLFLGSGFGEGWGLARTASPGAAATSIVDGQETSFFFLSHIDRESARENAAVVGELMDERARCLSPPSIDSHGTIVVVSCATDGRSWSRDVSQRFPIF